MNNEIEIRFQSKMENIAIIRNMVGVILIDENPTVSFVNEIKTVVSEAITNAIVHGYQNKEDCYVNIMIKIALDRIIIDIIDDGIGIDDIEKAREPLFTTKENEERSGLGFTIMELFSSEFSVESTVGVGTRVHIEKKF